MAHKLIHTDALVLGAKAVGEADRVFSLLAPDLGLVEVRAIGIRYLKSRLRYHLQPYDYASVALVHGRGTRVVSARRQRVGLAVRTAPSRQGAWRRICLVLRRFVRGESPIQPLFAVAVSALAYLDQHELTARELQQWEMVALLRLLYHLGYIEPRPPYEKLMVGLGWDQETVCQSPAAAAAVLGAINQALSHSHL